MILTIRPAGGNDANDPSGGICVFRSEDQEGPFQHVACVQRVGENEWEIIPSTFYKTQQEALDAVGRLFGQEVER